MSKFRNNLLKTAILALSAWLLISCSDNEPAARPTLPLATRVAAVTLPPTWTPAPTSTSTATPTPIPSATITLTPTATVTLAADEICEQFTLISAPEQGASLPYASFIAFSWDGSPPDSIVVLSVVHAATGEETLAQFPPEYQRNAFFELFYLPTWGTHRWTLSLFLESYGELCPIRGTFFREPWWNQPIANPLAPPFIFKVVE